jgi:hypothetical protein
MRVSPKLIATECFFDIADFADALVAALAENQHKVDLLDLSHNPLGRSGVRTLLAAKLRGGVGRLVLKGVSLVDLHDTGARTQERKRITRVSLAFARSM